MSTTPLSIRLVAASLILPSLLFFALATTSAQTAAAAAPASANDPVKLSPFTVNTDKDDGFAASNAGTATRLALDMKDVPAAYSVMTREFIDALGITNVQDAAAWAPNGSGTPPEGNSQDAFQQPMQFNIRGVNNNSGQQRFSAIDLTTDLAKRPAARQLRASLLRYAASEKFAPAGALTQEQLHAIVKAEQPN